MSALPSTSKYSNKRMEVDGVVFASRKEGRRYIELKVMERAGLISGLLLQRRYPLYVNGLKICTYVADFEYVEQERLVVEDVKGVRTDAYRIKRKLMEAVHGIIIRES